MSDNSDISSVRVVIEGRVQRVGFRYWVIDQANARNLRGWVRNLQSGNVEALFSGSKQLVMEMINLCHQGPSAARVDSIQEFSAENPTEPGFQYLPTI